MNYADHYYRLGSVIRNTVSQAQDTLYRLKLGRVRQCWLDVVERLNPVQPAGPPQTLGELCIELAQDAILEDNELPHRKRECWWLECLFYPDPHRCSLQDIQELRRVLYHKHKDPKEERLYRLIDLVRTA